MHADSAGSGHFFCCDRATAWVEFAAWFTSGGKLLCVNECGMHGQFEPGTNVCMHGHHVILCRCTCKEFLFLL